MRDDLKAFIQDIKNEEFKEAHERLEPKWKEYKKAKHPLKNLLKGFINGASAFELVKRDNFKGANTLWSAHIKYLSLMSENIECYELFKEADNLLQELAKKRL